MANLDFPGGFEPVRRRDNTELVCEYAAIDPANVEIGKYDPLERNSDGYLQPCIGASVTWVGVSASHVAANTGGEIAYYPIEGLIMVAQVDDATVDDQTDFDLLYEFTVGPVDPLTGRSTYEIAGATQAADPTLPIKLLRVAPEISQNGNALGANVKVEVIANAGAFKGAGLIG